MGSTIRLLLGGEGHPCAVRFGRDALCGDIGCAGKCRRGSGNGDETRRKAARCEKAARVPF